MKIRHAVVLALLLVVCSGCANPYKPEEPKLTDPWQGCNEGIYVFNDRLYFWVVKPVSEGWAFVLPEYGRERLRNFLFNLNMPNRFINTLFQGNLKGTGVVLGRFVTNTTVGGLGFWDPAGHWGMKPRREDFGQTFAIWRMAPGPYAVIPFFGPKTLRGTAGLPLDIVLSPVNWIPGGSLIQRINSTSLRLGQYEGFKEDALDPYVALRNAYWQNRVYKIRNEDSKASAGAIAQ